MTTLATINAEVKTRPRFSSFDGERQIITVTADDCGEGIKFTVALETLDSDGSVEDSETLYHYSSNYEFSLDSHEMVCDVAVRHATEGNLTCVDLCNDHEDILSTAEETSDPSPESLEVDARIDLRLALASALEAAGYTIIPEDNGVKALKRTITGGLATIRVELTSCEIVTPVKSDELLEDELPEVDDTQDPASEDADAHSWALGHSDGPDAQPFEDDAYDAMHACEYAY
jgi:hypothetical protein